MRIYLVGGAVRDYLLNREIKERDWVVVGSSPEEMLALGYLRVGHDFPVFLHPKTHEEYALARKERKIESGYHGFICDASRTITLEEDLSRRDLTINAMAIDINYINNQNNINKNKIIDPYGGQQDLNLKILRHVSPAFSEDPVRLLRVARMAARFPDFQIAPETLLLMQQIVAKGEVDALVAERVWKEFSRALSETKPLRFFEVLKTSQALDKILPEFNRSEIFILLNNINIIRNNINNSEILLAMLCTVLTKLELDQLANRLKLPKNYRQLAEMTQRAINLLLDLDKKLNSEEILIFFEKIDYFRRSEYLEAILKICEIYYKTFYKNNKNYKNININIENIKQAASILSNNKKLNYPQNLSGLALAQWIKSERIKLISKIIK